MFYGEFHHTIDEKGRLIMPAKYREQLGASFFITKDLWNKEEERCLFVYPQSEFNELSQKLHKLSNSSKEARFMNRYFFSSVQDTAVDKQGRVLLTTELREHACINREVVLVGVDTHIEIWDLEKWEAYNASDTLEMDKLAESLGELGI